MNQDGLRTLLHFFCSVLIVLITPLLFANPPTFTPELKLIRELPRTETADRAILKTDSYLFFGSGPSVDQEPYRLWVYDLEKEEIVHAINIPHSIQHITEESPNSVLVSGKVIDPWQSKITKIVYKKDSFKSSTTSIPQEILVENTLFYKNKLFFSEPGDRRVLISENGYLRIFSDNIFGPSQLVGHDNNLFVLEKHHWQHGDENIVRINLNTNEKKKLFKEQSPLRGMGITYLRSNTSTNSILANQWIDSSVLVIDADTFKVRKTLSIGDTPEGLASFGHCAFVTSIDGHYVSLFDLRDGTANTALASWSYQEQKELLTSARTIEAHEKKDGSVLLFLRSALPTISASSNSSVMQMRLQDSVLKSCKSQSTSLARSKWL